MTNNNKTGRRSSDSVNRSRSPVSSPRYIEYNNTVYNSKSTRKQTFYDLNYKYWYPTIDTLQLKVNASYKKYCNTIPYCPTKIVVESWAR